MRTTFSLVLRHKSLIDSSGAPMTRYSLIGALAFAVYEGYFTRRNRAKL